MNQTRMSHWSWAVVAAATLATGCGSDNGAAPITPTQLAFVVQPARSLSGSPIAPALQVELRDSRGARVTSASNAVTIAIAANPSVATLGGTTTVNAVGGIATFTDLTLDRRGTGYTLVASSSGLAATSDPFDVVTALIAASVSTGDEHTCARTAAGTATCWGRNTSGQLGDGTTTDRRNPVLVGGMHAFSFVSAVGYAQSCGVATGGAAYCWGMNLNGKLGDGTIEDRSSPAAVQGGLSFASINSGFFHACGLTSSAAAYCWGYNNTGQLGNGGPLEGSATPVPVAGGHTFTSVSTMNFHTCATTTDNALYCWGSNNSGALGGGMIGQPETTPLRVAPGLSFASVSAGFSHTCALTTAGVAHCWGSNAGGKLGDGTTTSRITPAPVNGGLTFAAVTAGGDHTCGLTIAGTAHCWGSNAHGQLGDGTTTTRTIPTAVAGGLTFTMISAGFAHTCGRTTAGTIHCWGWNERGQIGDGTLVNKNRPELVIE
jgi:alpha-tubulin suppressor-like RCC1 family protein